LCASPPKINNCGRPQKWNRDELQEAVKEVPIYQRRTIRSLASALNVPKSTLFRMKGERGNNTVILSVSIVANSLLTSKGPDMRFSNNYEFIFMQILQIIHKSVPLSSCSVLLFRTIRCTSFLRYSVPTESRHFNVIFFN
jgi:hypothetical protein